MTTKIKILLTIAMLIFSTFSFAGRDKKSQKRITPLKRLFVAVEASKVDLVIELLSLVNVNEPNDEGEHILGFVRDPAILDILVDAGARPMANTQGATPLHAALERGDVAMTRALLSREEFADQLVSAVDRHLRFAFDLVPAQHRFSEMDLQLLRPSEALREEQRRALLAFRPQTDLFMFVRENNLVEVRRLLERGANPNFVDPDGRTALFFAISDKMVMLLFEFGATLATGPGDARPRNDRLSQNVLHHLLGPLGEELMFDPDSIFEPEEAIEHLTQTAFALLQVNILEQTAGRLSARLELQRDEENQLPYHLIEGAGWPQELVDRLHPKWGQGRARAPHVPEHLGPTLERFNEFWRDFVPAAGKKTGSF